MEMKITWSTLAKQQLKDIGQYVADHPNVVYYIQFANQITIMAVAHEKQSPKTVSSMITRFIEHHMP